LLEGRIRCMRCRWTCVDSAGGLTSLPALVTPSLEGGATGDQTGGRDTHSCDPAHRLTPGRVQLCWFHLAPSAQDDLMLHQPARLPASVRIDRWQLANSHPRLSSALHRSFSFHSDLIGLVLRHQPGLVWPGAREDECATATATNCGCKYSH
jgi:hypothetical protein